MTTPAYLSFYFNYPLNQVFVLYLLGVARLIPLIDQIPFLGGKILPAPIKVGFALVLSFVFLPVMLHQSVHATDLGVMTFIFLIVKELLIGYLMGFLVAVPFSIASAAGALIDHQRGAQALQVRGPTSMDQTSPTGVVYNNMLLIIFFMIGAPILLFDAIYTSYSIVPADAFLHPAFFTSAQPIWGIYMRLLNQVLALASQLAAPSLIGILMSDLFLGIANRMAPQVQISFLLWSAKAYVGVVLIWTSWWLLLKVMRIEGIKWMEMIQHLAESVGT